MHFVSSTNDLREYLDLAGAKNINFSNISTDTRSISKDALFIAIKGPNFDGNKFIDQAFDNGAVAVLTSDTQYKNNTNPTLKINSVTEIFESLDIQKHTKNMINSYHIKAMKHLDEINSIRKDPLVLLCKTMMGRDN